MRHLILSAALVLAAPHLALAAADCPAAFDTAATHYIGNQTQLTVCLQSDISLTQRLRQQQLDFEAELLAQQKNFELQLRLQQTQPILPQITLPMF